MKIFKELGFKIEIMTNLKIVHFLDIAFNLTHISAIEETQ